MKFRKFTKSPSTPRPLRRLYYRHQASELYDRMRVIVFRGNEGVSIFADKNTRAHLIVGLRWTLDEMPEQHCARISRELALQLIGKEGIELADSRLSH